ncbi:MAG: hypothetical protein J6V82_00650, partial [Clostridia bacterium]|nr:hypothetical protein [Clostridia bacterium]
LCTFAQETPETSPFGLYVGGVAVTEQNATDIFGDGCAVYDATKNTLTLNGFNKTGISTLDFEEDIADFSVYAEKDTHIRITGKNNVFYNTVCTVGGNISVESAEVAFKGEGFSFLLCIPSTESGKSGDMRIFDSEVKVLGFDKIYRYGFCAANLIFERSAFEMVLTKAGEHFQSSLFYAEKELHGVDANYLINTPFPYVTSLFQGGEIVFSGTTVDVSGAEYVFHSTERNGCDGSLSFVETEISVKDSRCLADTVSAYVERSDIFGALYYSGIRAAQAPAKPSLTVTNASITLSCLPFEKLEMQLGKMWQAMDAKSKQAYRNDYDYYVSYTRDSIYPDRFAQGFGVAVSGGDVSFEKSTLSCEGFRTALFAQYAVTMTLKKAVTLDLKATEAAFIMASSEEDALRLPNRMRTRFSSLREMPADESLTDECPYLFGAAKKRLTLPSSETVVQRTDLLDLLEGEAEHIRIRTAPFIPLWITLTVTGTFTLAALGTGILFIIKDSPARKDAKKKKQK